MKKLFWLLPLVLAACTASKKTTVTQPYQVNQTALTNTLQYLTADELEGRDSGSKGIELAANYLEDILKQNQIQPYFATYKDTLRNFNNGVAYNVVGFVEGTDAKLKNEIVIFGAHYDHIGIVDKIVDGDSIANGANDNAAGSAILTEVAKYIASKPNKRSALIVFFSAEEKGLLGAYHLADKLEKDSLDFYTMLNFEMLGVPMNRDFKTYITGHKKSNISAKINEYTNQNFVGFLPMETQYRLFMASDNFPFFLKYNFPAHSISSFDFDNYKFYHHVDDEFEKMDTQFMAQIVTDLLPAIDQMMNSETKEIKLNE
ncbi:M28 family peptidase [Flavobacterium agricola]|uniref:M28 family peptidase n=1 Tax=Flavobacterium agricola TaxID=2870839 RepID=A0ABY6M2U2_9FLAO|nr:M28 family peptidase [Flavobacterium agricola]UYW01476.1 M28 family peptidase [Flavobacterium agricola]